MTEQHVSLWSDPGEQNDNQQQASVTTTDAAGESSMVTTTDTTEQNPIAAAIDASAWEREDIELALSVGQFLLMAYFVYKYQQGAGSR